MAAYTLTTTPQVVGRIRMNESGSGDDRTFAVLAHYSANTATSKNIVIQLRFDSNGSVSGSGKCKVNNDSGTNFSFSKNSTVQIKTYVVNYNAQGQARNNSLKVALSNMSARWSDNTSFDATPRNSVDTTFDLPDIDPTPTVGISGISIINGGYPDNSGNAVSMISTLRVSMNFTYAQSAVLTVTGAGITRTYTIAVTKASSESKTQDIPLTEFASASNFNLSFSLQATNDTGNATATSSKAVKGYFLPRYATQTYTRRCDSQGNADSQGDYGRLYLKWDVATVDSSNPNTLQTCVVKLNGTVITATSGSIALGYLDFIFPLAVNVQGNLEVVLTDRISSNTITSLVVPKSTMPLSMYQSGDSVGVSIGRMCTEAGLWIYEQMHYKDPSSTSIYDIVVEDGYLKASGSATPLPFLEVREVTATISKAVNSSVAISAPSVTDYDFVGWIGVATYGWIASVYIGNNNASTNVYVAANAGTTTGTGTVRAYALYQRSNS